MKILPKKQYQVWQYIGYEGWDLEEFDTLKEAMESHKLSSEWLLTKRPKITISDLD